MFVNHVFGNLKMGRLSEHYEFDGDTYAPALDRKRLSGQLERVFNSMSDWQWHSLADLSLHLGGTEASMSARLRDLRKSKFGSHVIDRRRVGTTGLFQYKLVGRST
jgi:hypothetical protein